MHLSTLLGWTGPVLQLWLAGILVRRKLYRRARFPFFTSYTLYSVLASFLRKCISSNSASYYMLYWSTEAIYAILALLSLNEVFRRLHRLDYKDFRWFRFLLPVTALLIVTVALWEALHSGPIAQHHPP